MLTQDKVNIYFAGPLFNQAEKDFNIQVTRRLEEIGCRVFLPQRDGIESSKYEQFSREERRKLIFQTDRDEILKADIFLIILDGRVPDEGACVELGIAYLQKYLQQKDRLLVGLHTDRRAAFFNAKLNPMLVIPLDCIFEKVEDLIHYFGQFIVQKKPLGESSKHLA